MRTSFITASAIALFLPLAAGATGVQVTIQGQSIVFTDVDQSAWFASYVQDATQAGIVNGYKDTQGNLTGRFGPANNVTIAQALKIAIEGAGYDTSKYSTINSGVGNHWASMYVSVALGEHFSVTGSPSTLDRAASRAEVASIFTSAFHVNMDTAGGVSFSDVSPNSPSAQSIAALSRDNVVSGDTNADGSTTGTFRPNDSINRAETVKIVMLARTKYGEPGQGREPSLGMNTSVIIQNFQFLQKTLTVKQGTTVTWKNEDTTAHTVTGDNGGPQSGQLSQGQSYSYTFNSLGTFSYHCSNHPMMTATVTVTQ